MTATLATFPTRVGASFDPSLPGPQRLDRLMAVLPPPLRDLLAEGRIDRRPRFVEDSFDGMVERWIPPSALTEQDAILARRALDELAAGVLAPAPANHLLGRILALLSHYPAKGTTAEVEQMVALDWAEDLGEYPAWAIDAAARRWRRTRKWRPSIAEMRALCDEATMPERALVERLRAVVAAAGAGTTAADTPGTSVRAMVATAVRRPVP